ncbi:MAG: DNA alkylation repair protein [Gemmatimonas sp.]|nr:DNA alkylation repair protein [Gemmatimonas sp.]
MDPVTDLRGLEQELGILADSERATSLQRFFKTGPGQYGEGDQFLGIRVPHLRALARRSRALPLDAAVQLLHSPWHEERLLALLLLVDRYRRGDSGERDEIHRVYLANTSYINNWDLVDTSAEHIVGAHVTPNQIGLLEQLARSDSVWERRIAMMATFYWIKRTEYRPALRIANLLVQDGHDLIHKVVGWMLREIGKRDRATEEEFLLAHNRRMPRTMLRYSLEHFPAERRQAYLRGEA